MKHLPREHQRAYITFYLRVYEGENFLGFLIDISDDGIKLLSDFLLNVEKFYSLKMKLPSSLEWKGKKDIDRYIDFTAQCLWSKHDSVDKEFYISGFQFTDFGDEERTIVDKMIELYKIP